MKYLIKILLALSVFVIIVLVLFGLFYMSEKIGMLDHCYINEVLDYKLPNNIKIKERLIIKLGGIDKFNSGKWVIHYDFGIVNYILPQDNQREEIYSWKIKNNKVEPFNKRAALLTPEIALNYDLTNFQMDELFYLRSPNIKDSAPCAPTKSGSNSIH